MDWLKLIVVSAVVAIGFNYLHIPAALLLAPMIVGIFFSIRGSTLSIHPSFFYLSQGVIGVMIAESLPINMIGEAIGEWPVFLFGTMSTIVISCILGWCLSYLPLLPGPTALWGLSPGAASVMTIMSEDYGADMQLVAFIQYLRMLCCAISAALLAFYLGLHQVDQGSYTSFLVIHSFKNTLITLLIALGVPWLNRRYLKIPGGAITLPIFVCILLEFLVGFRIEIPYILLVVSYALVGWSVGFRFTKQIVIHVVKLFPYVFAAIVLLLVSNALFAWVLSIFLHIDYLTAFLATSPGGMDSIAIIAANTNVNAPFVMAMQLVRFIIVLLIYPYLARVLSKRLIKE